MKHTPLGYFRYFYNALGNKLLFNIFLATLVGLLDGLGLALFIPLLQFVNDGVNAAGQDVMGGLGFIIKAFTSVGIPLNLFTVLTLMVVVFATKGAMNYWLTMEQVDLRQRYMIALRTNQIKALEKLSYQGFLKLDAGRIQNVVTVEVGKNIQAMIQFLATTKAVILLTSYIVLAFIANWQFALFILFGGWVANYLYRGITENVKASSIAISKRNGLFSGFIIQAISSFKYLKSTNYFPKYATKLRQVIYDVEKLNRKIGRSQAITFSTREPVIIAIVAVVILVQVNFLGGSLGPILLSLLLFYRALNGLVTVQTAWQMFMQNIGGLQAVSEMETAMLEATESIKPVPFVAFDHSIELKQVSFNYDRKQVLKEVNLLVPKNKTIALVGESGSGKTTLANVITTLLPPKSGTVLVDGKDLYDYDLNSFREKIGYITQDAVIYSDDIFNNITFWAEPTPENFDRFWNVLKKVSLYDFVHTLELKEKTQLGDNGILISGGQKQRISIARELFKNIEMLVLDEATSALDSQTEHFIQSSINELQGQYTMIVIAHRLSTIRNADIIYLVDKGSIIASGSYEQLLTDSSLFRRMVSLQNVYAQ